MALCDKLKGRSAAANPVSPLQVKAGKILKTWCFQQEAEAWAVTFVPLALTLQADPHYVLRTVLACLLTAACFPAFDALACLSMYLQLHLWVQPSAAPVLGGLIYSVCKVAFRMDFILWLVP